MGNEWVAMKLVFGKEVERMAGQDDVDAENLTEVVQDLIEDIFGLISIFEGAGTMAEDFALVTPENEISYLK